MSEAVVKVFEVNDLPEHFAGRTEEEVMKSYAELYKLPDHKFVELADAPLREKSKCAQCGKDEGEHPDPRELGAADLERYKFVDEDGSTRTFREQLQKLIAEGEQFPCFFASSEY